MENNENYNEFHNIKYINVNQIVLFETHTNINSNLLNLVMFFTNDFPIKKMIMRFKNLKTLNDYYRKITESMNKDKILRIDMGKKSDIEINKDFELIYNVPYEFTI